MTRRCASLAALASACIAVPALACPNCAASRIVNAAVWSGPNFWPTVLAVISPFPVFVAIAVWFYRLDWKASPRPALHPPAAMAEGPKCLMTGTCTLAH